MLVFIAITFSFTWISWSFAFLSVTGKIFANEKIFHIAGVFGPLIGSIAISLMYGGKKEAYNLLRKGLKLKIQFKWYLWVIFLFPAISFVSILIQHNFDIGKIDFSAFHNIGNLLVLFIIMLLFAPIGEEFGWRGFLLEEFQKKFSPLFSSIAVGIIWGTWHLPFFFIPGKVLNNFFEISPFTLILFPFYTVGLSIIYSWIYNATGKSVFMVILLHCMTNWSFETFYPSNSFEGFNITYGLIGAIAILLTVISIGKPNFINPVPGASQIEDHHKS